VFHRVSHCFTVFHGDAFGEFFGYHGMTH
jgi:hypothetical protein